MESMGESVMKPFLKIVDAGLKETFEDLETALEGLTADELNWRPTLDSNNISWLVWHMARVEDNWVNLRLRQRESVWDAEGWSAKLGIDAQGNGWGQSAAEIRGMPAIDVGRALEYYRRVREETSHYFEVEMEESDLAAEVEHPSGDPNMNWTYDRVLGHLLAEEAQHLGQVAYLRGMMRGLDG